MTILSVDKLEKTYRVPKKGRVKVIEALQGISLEAEPGEIIGVIGPSRAGKTTLLRIVAGVSLPSAGTVRGIGRVVPLLAPGTFFEKENSGERSAREIAELFGVPPEVVEAKLDEMFEFAGLQEFREVPVKRYSRGMYLRLAFAVALGLDPDIFVVDDVLGVGDLDFQERCIERLQELARTGGLVMLVSHDPPTLSRLCTRLLWLEDGEIVRDGEPRALLDEYAESSARVAESNVLHFERGAESNSSCEITAVRLVDEAGEPIDEAGRGQQVGIELQFEMLEAGFAPLCAVDVFARGGLAFRSEADPVELDPGPYTSIAWIPGGLLAPTTYAVRAEITMAERNQVRSIELSFPVRPDPDEEALERWLAAFPGQVSPLLEWSIEAVRESAADE